LSFEVTSSNRACKNIAPLHWIVYLSEWEVRLDERLRDFFMKLFAVKSDILKSSWKWLELTIITYFLIKWNCWNFRFLVLEGGELQGK
jgi:hypothetical protein